MCNCLIMAYKTYADKDTPTHAFPHRRDGQTRTGLFGREIVLPMRLW